MENLKNFIMNMNPTMLKVKHGEKLTESECNQIVQFYLEVIHVCKQGKI